MKGTIISYMKIMIIRHGEPDYTIDSLTEKGWREAEYLAERMSEVKVDECYVSPLGRARDTAMLSLKKMKKEATTLPWLREFDPPVKRPDAGGKEAVAWDWLPEQWTIHDNFFLPNEWMNNELFDEANVAKEIGIIYAEFEKLLNEHGYKKEGRLFRAVAPNNKTIVFFCHFGIECVLLSYLLNVSPMVLWHGFCAAPSSVTTICTEERRPGNAYFRVTSFGDTSHLYVHNEPTSFAARFCECYTNTDERHD